MKQSSTEAVVCLHEDRLAYFPGIQFAIASLHRHSPELKIALSFPNSSLEADKWIAKQQGVVRIYLDHGSSKGWNIKPDLILMLLECGHSQVIWLDADVIVNGPILTELTTQSEDMLISTEEPYWGQQQGNVLRTKAWALVPFRMLSATVNTGVIRVTQNHLQLIKDWQTLLGHPAYLAMQKLPDMQRPIHMLGDQEVLTALLGGKKYGLTPVRLLRRGVEIAQCFGAGGFGVGERLKNTFLRRNPQLIHAMGKKPWSRSVKPPKIFSCSGKLISRINAYYEYLMLEASPYLVVASRIKGEEISDSVWLTRHSFGGKFLASVGFNSVNLTGLPLAVVDSCGKLLKRILKINRFSTDEKHFLTDYPLD